MTSIVAVFGHASVARLLLLNCAYLGIGVSLLRWLRMVDWGPSLLARGGVAYLAGVSVTAIASAHLALIGWLPGALEIEGVAGVTLLATIRFAGPASGASRLKVGDALASFLAASVALVQVVHALPTAYVKPLRFEEWDSWAIWSLKGRALSEFGTAQGQVFLDRAYQLSHLDYPILQPTLSALAGSSVGGWSVPAMRMQLVLLAAASVWAIVGLAETRLTAVALGAAVVAITSQPWFLEQLLTGYADVPVAALAGASLVAIANHAVRGDRRMLVLAALFGGAAGLIKNEGALAVVVTILAFVVHLAVARRWLDLRSLGLAALGTLALWAPWRAFVAIHGLPSNDFQLADAFHPTILRDRFDRLGPATRAVWDQLEPSSLTAPLALLAAALVAAALARRWADVAGALCWLGFSIAGLAVVYWISGTPLPFQLATSVDRVTVTVLLGATLYSAVLVGHVLDRSPERI